VFWKEEEMEKMLVSLISTMSYLQGIGICHWDIKPSNLFLMDNGEIKVIDFGESKDYFAESDDGGDGTMATIRGTPQYLSPILWKAYVVDKNTRHATHNIYKSDVFSEGLVFLQLASLDDVTGCNHLKDGEAIIEEILRGIRERYSEHIVEIIRLMLKFDEAERPSFIELAKLVLTSETNTLNTPNAQHEPNPFAHASSAINRHPDVSARPWSAAPKDRALISSHNDSVANRITQTDLFKNYVGSNKLYLNQSPEVFFFETAGIDIGRLDILPPEEGEDPASWKRIGNSKFEFQQHHIIIYAQSHGFFILGGTGKKNNLHFTPQKEMIFRSPMPEKTFFSAVYLNNYIYTFGGYDNYDKIQLKSCEVYSIEKDEWKSLDCQLNTARSQSSACIFED
jgi:serine/threonine protein kinase